MQTRLGYVGCGFMAQKVHLPNFASLDSCRLVALAEVRSDLRREVGARFGVEKLYSTHLELADDPEIEAVAVSADYSIQGQIACDLLRRGKNVFMEKPMATTIERAQQILDAEREGQARLMVGYMKRYDAGNIVAREHVRQMRNGTEAGRITLVRNHGFCGDWVAGLDTPMSGSKEQMPPSTPIVPDWMPPSRAGSYLGYLQQYTHNINLMRWLLDADDRAKVKLVDLDEDGYTGIVVLELDGVRATLESGTLSHYRWDEHTQIYFQHGWVKTDAPPLLLRGVPAEVEVYRAGKTQSFTKPLPDPAWSWSYKREAEHFIECVQSGASFDSTAQDTLTDVRLFEEIFQMWLRNRGEI